MTRSGKARPDGQRRLDVELGLDDLLAGLADAVGRAAADSPGVELVRLAQPVPDESIPRARLAAGTTIPAHPPS